MTAFGVQVGGLDIEADMPAGAVPADRREQDSGARRHYRLPCGWVEVGDRAKQPPQPAGVMVNSDNADCWQGHRAGMTIPNSDRGDASTAVLVAKPETIPTAALALPLREANPPALAVAALGLCVGRQRPTKINRRLLEDLSGDLVPPSKAGYLLGDSAVSCGDEDAPGSLTAFPGIEGVDQVKP